MLNLSIWLNHSGYFNHPTTASITEKFILGLTPCEGEIW